MGFTIQTRYGHLTFSQVKFNNILDKVPSKFIGQL